MYPIHKYNLCRLCLFVGDQLMDIFEENESIDFIAQEAIEDLLQFKVVKETGCPWLMCLSCLEKLTEFRLFKRRCIECKFTFEERYLNAEESDAVEIKPEEMQIKEEYEGESAEPEKVERSPCRKELEGDEDYCAEDHIGTQVDSDTGDDAIKSETQEDDTDGLSGSQKIISVGDMVEVKVEEVNVEDDLCAAVGDDDVESILPDNGRVDSSPCRNRLTVCDGSVSYKSSEMVGGREEFMCAVCEEIFLDLDSLRRHMPCGARTSGPVPTGIVGNVGGRSMDWERDLVQCYDSGQFKRESGVGVVPGDPLGVGDAGGTIGDGSRYVPGGYTGNLSRGSHVSKTGNVILNRKAPRARNMKTTARGLGRPRPVISTSVVTDKTISYQCDMCRHGFSRLDKLKKHIQSHSEEGGYACPTCGKSFRTRWSLKNHRKSHFRVTQYECPICSRKFSRPQHLEAHRATHGTGTEYQCGICRKTFPQSSYLEMHLKTHEGDESTQCHICGKRFSRKNVLTVHLRVHMGIKPYECQVCHKRFSQKVNLKTHAATHEGTQPYSCDLCHKSFADKADLNRHFRSHSGGPPRGKAYVPNKNLLTHQENNPSTVGFNPNRDLPSHSGMGVEVKPEVTMPEPCITPDLSHLPVSITRVKLNPVSQKNDGSRGTVRMKTSTSQSSLVPEPSFSISPVIGPVVPARNRMVDLGSPDRDEKPVLNLGLDLTSKGFDGSHHEAIGMMGHPETGPKVRPYKCQICHKCFGHKDELNNHAKVHSHAKPHTCEICGKRFTEGLNLRKHMLVHVEGKTPECPFCAKAFTLRKNLKRHLELDSCLRRLDLNTSECISPPSGNKALDSVGSWGQSEGEGRNASVGGGTQNPGGDPSGKNAMDKTLDDIMAAAKEASVEVFLEQEGSVSRVFPCTICEKTFLRTDQLKKHLMVHGGIKPHACTICSRRFTEKGNLSKHMKTHAYEKPYPCSFCEKAYTQKKNLERHILSHQSADTTA
ncbi:zinc finger protein 84-like [Hetaerina americana]|uniref:zinc finger protein 84-like n=1 Tax=Hetaerina americana TaxID=62018 RepID=UPI003A7F541D